MLSRQKVEHCVGLYVVAGVVRVVIESKTWLTRTWGIGSECSGPDVILS